LALAVAETLKRTMDLAFGRSERDAVAFLKEHAWLLVPDLTVAMLAARNCGVYSEAALDDEYRVDFAVYSVESSELRWQLVEVQSPTARLWVQDGRRYTAAFSEAQHQIQRWQHWLATRGQAASRRYPNIHNRCDFRLVIGRSDMMTVTEREALHGLRDNAVRVRTFYWFYEKLARFTDTDIEEMEKLGHARSQRELLEDASMLAQWTT
jgi:hypothetical protein